MFMNKRERLAPVQQRRSAERQFSGFQEKNNRTKSKFTTGIQERKEESDKQSLDWDDISLSSDDSKSFERFFKKEENSKKRVDGKEKDKKKSTVERPKTARGAADIQNTAKRPTSSNALNKLAAIEAKIKNRKDAYTAFSLSGSDFGLDISSDMEVKKEVGKADVKLRDKFKKEKKQSRKAFLTIADTSETSEEDSAEKYRFSKGARNKSEELESDNSVADNIGSKTYLTKREEQNRPSHSISGTMGKDVSKSNSVKRVTFSSELQQASDVDQSLDKFMPTDGDNSDDPSSLNDIIQSSIHNVMSLDDLVASEEVDLEKMDDIRPSSALGFAGLHSIEELIPAEKEVQSSIEFIPSMQEEVDYSESSDAVPNLMSNVRSLDDLMTSESEKCSQEEKAAQAIGSKPATGVFRSQEIVEESEAEEIPSESPKYTEDFHSDEADDDTLKDTESIAQDISDDNIMSSSISTEDSQIPEAKSSHSSYSSYSTSSSSTITTSIPTPRIQRPKTATVTIETQTDSTAKPWIPGLSFIDSAYFKPTRLVQGEILDALSAQNPAATALHDLLKQQLDLTREFIAKARLLHDRAVDSIPKDYIYGQIDEARLERLKKIWYDDYDDRT